MNVQIIPFKVAPLTPAAQIAEEMYCGKKNCCKKFKKGKRCKKASKGHGTKGNSHAAQDRRARSRL